MLLKNCVYLFDCCFFSVITKMLDISMLSIILQCVTEFIKLGINYEHCHNIIIQIIGFHIYIYTYTLEHEIIFMLCISDESSRAYGILENLTRVARFNMVIMFMTDNDKNGWLT